MSRPIVLSNGSMHVGINTYGSVHDFYFPYVGLENHSAGKGSRHKIGVWIDGVVSWLDEDGWKLSFATADFALVGHTIAKNESLGILLEFDDFVASSQNVFVRNIHVVNLKDTDREVRVFMHQAFIIGDTRSNTDTAQYLPDSNAILHYRGRRAFVVSGKSDGVYFDQHAIGLFGIEGHEGTYKDADDGELGCGNVEHGRVDSTLRFVLHIGALSSKRIEYWVAAGCSTREALDVHKSTQEIGIHTLLHSTASWWHSWLRPSFEASKSLNAVQRKQFIKSAMVVKAHIDNNGAVIASTDTTMLNYSRDAYGYCWPRDGAFALWPLIRIGYTEEPKKFFAFCRDALHPKGYLMHKYQADGALGSSWHPYVHGSISAPPIQEDETALTVFVFAQFYASNKSIELLDEFYTSLVKPAATFMAGHIEESTGLPKASYDLWEENFLTTTYTVSTVYAALHAAAGLAEEYGDADSAVAWRSAADDIHRAAHKHLYNDERKMFYKGILVKEDGEVYKDETFDLSSFYGAFMFGLFDQTSDEIKTALISLRKVFNVTPDQPAVPRYENDNYQRTDSSIQGNYWFITTLWLAQFALETGDTDTATRTLEWIEKRLDATGMMSEQIHPHTDDALSVSPLTWSHAEYISTTLDMILDSPS